MDGELRSRAAAKYREHYDSAPECVAFAPGRVEILGNHTDYNGGGIISAALELGIAVAGGRGAASERTIELWSDSMGERRRFALDSLAPVPHSWTNYPCGVVQQIIAAGVHVDSTRLAIVASLPIGAGVSSSAALETATADALFSLYGGAPEDPMVTAQLCRRAEVEFAGMPCGLLDQFSVRYGREDCLLYLDCRSLEHERIATPPGTLRVLVSDTGVEHALVDGKYASLRSSCERAARALGESLGRPVEALRDVSPEEFREHAGALHPSDRPRAQHVVEEITRVETGRVAAATGDFAALGELMHASHASCRDLFGNSIRELDALVEAARNVPGVYGAKLSGGGFGGATVTLVSADAATDVRAALERAYAREFSRELRVIDSALASGARIFPHDTASGDRP